MQHFRAKEQRVNIFFSIQKFTDTNFIVTATERHSVYFKFCSMMDAVDVGCILTCEDPLLWNMEIYVYIRVLLVFNDSEAGGWRGLCTNHSASSYINAWLSCISLINQLNPSDYIKTVRVLRASLSGRLKHWYSPKICWNKLLTVMTVTSLES